MNPVAIPMFQYDNWNIKPVHAVEVDGKAMPKVNGSLLQAHTRKKKGAFHIDSEAKRQRNAASKDLFYTRDEGDFCAIFPRQGI